MPRASLPKTTAIALGGVLLAGAAHAQAPMSFVPKGPAIANAGAAQQLNLSTATAPLGYALRAPAPLPRGVARTALEKQSSDLTGSMGVLCGIQPNADSSGASTARGYDPDGKFVGAKLALRF